MEHINNDEKVLQILAAIQRDMTEMKADMTEMKAKTDKIESDVKFTKETVVRMENDFGQKINALFDGYSGNYDLNKENDARITRLERDVEKLNIEVRFLKAAVNK